MAHVRKSKTVLDSGFQTADSGSDSRCWIPVYVSGSWTLGSNRYCDSGLLELYSGFKAQDSGFHSNIFQIPDSRKKTFSVLRNPDSLTWDDLSHGDGFRTP